MPVSAPSLVCVRWPHQTAQHALGLHLHLQLLEQHRVLQHTLQRQVIAWDWWRLTANL